jgi:hypothetical protein
LQSSIFKFRIVGGAPLRWALNFSRALVSLRTISQMHKKISADVSKEASKQFTVNSGYSSLYPI